MKSNDSTTLTYKTFIYNDVHSVLHFNALRIQTKVCMPKYLNHIFVQVLLFCYFKESESLKHQGQMGVQSGLKKMCITAKDYALNKH